MKLKLSFLGPTLPSKTPDKTNPAPLAHRLSRYAHFPFFKSGVTIPEIMQIKMLKNGKLCIKDTGSLISLLSGQQDDFVKVDRFVFLVQPLD